MQLLKSPASFHLTRVLGFDPRFLSILCQYVNGDNDLQRVQGQSRGPDHEGIALVPAQNQDQTAGRFYHVKGDLGMGMTYER